MSMTNAAQLRCVGVTGTAANWQLAGFALSNAGTQVPVGQTSLVMGQPSMWAAIDGIDELDGLVLRPATSCAEPKPAHAHSNKVVSIDHVVVNTPDVARTVAAFEAQGVPARRQRRLELRESIRLQTFFWLGDVIAEVVGPEKSVSEGPATWWGLAFVSTDLASTVNLFGENASPIRPAVQPRRHVSSVRSAAGLGVPTLLITPHEKMVQGEAVEGD